MNQLIPASNTVEAADNNRFSKRSLIGRCVYAVLFSDGWVKVGRGRCGKTRIQTHISTSTMRGATVVQSVISGRLVDSKAAESRLISYCARTGDIVHGKEWFVGVDFSRLSEIISTEFNGDSAEQFDAHHKVADAAMNKITGRLIPSSVPVSDEESARWEIAQAHAKLINHIFVSNLYSGQLFEIADYGISQFQMFVSLAFHAMDADDQAYAYHQVSTNLDDALSYLVERGSQVVDDYRAGKVAA